jgi:G3E family GTPase
MGEARLAGTVTPRRPPPPLPVTILTGFLGAGKTSLLNRLLRDPALSGTLVLINEFGAVGLDHLLVEKVDSDMILMASGCVCCTIRGDLIATFEDVMRRLDNGRMPAIDRILIETTGLADPAPIIHTMIAHPYLSLRLRLDGVVTVVDALLGAATLDAHPQAARQIAVADRIALSKTDLVEPATGGAALAALRARLADLNPGAPVLDIAAGEATAARLLDAGVFSPDGKIADVAAWLRAEAVAGAGSHPAGAPSSRHGDDIRAFCLTEVAPISPARLDLFLEMLRAVHGKDLLRVKGLVALDDDPARPLLVHGVQHLFHPPRRLEAWPDADRRTRLVFIARGLALPTVRTLWRALAGAPATDTPDAAALLDNPLAPSSSGGLFG